MRAGEMGGSLLVSSTWESGEMANDLSVPQKARVRVTASDKAFSAIRPVRERRSPSKSQPTVLYSYFKSHYRLITSFINPIRKSLNQSSCPSASSPSPPPKRATARRPS